MATIVKEEVIQMLRGLPDNATVEDILDEIYFKMVVDAGLKELDEGRDVPHEAVEARVAKWLDV